MKRQRWIDIAKFVAILGVLIDHMNGILYTNMKYAYISYYSVSLFILLMGVTTYMSFDNTKVPLRMKVIQKIKGILIPYTGAVFLCYIIMLKSFDFKNFWVYLINFNILAPHYYVLLYLQLIIICPILFLFLKKTTAIGDHQKYKCFVYELVCGVIIGYLSYLTSRYTNICDVYGGGGKLFGGSYLLLLYVGMVYGKYRDGILKSLKISIRAVLGMVFFVLAIAVWRMMAQNGLFLDGSAVFGKGVNPPGFTFMAYAFCILNAIILIDAAMEKLSELRVIQLALIPVSWVGQRTLYIFLYHMLVVIVIANPLFSDMNKWEMRILYMLSLIILPCLMGEVLKKIRSFISLSYSYISEVNNGKNNA